MTATTESGQLEWEARAGRYAAAAAFAAALAPLVGGLVLSSSIGAPGESAVAFLRAVDEGAVGVVVGAVIGALGPPMLAASLLYLYRAIRARRGQGVPSFLPPVLAVAAVALAAVLITQQVLRVDEAAEFATATDQSEETAEEILDTTTPAAVSAAGSIASVAFAVSVILIALNAMRAGLLSRFMGIIGIALGSFYVIPLLGGPVPIQLFWGIALGFLFLGRWPGGRGPAWERVEAVPWPTAADRAEAQRQRRDEAEGEGDAQLEQESDRPGAEEAPRSDPAQPRPASRKRRRGR